MSNTNQKIPQVWIWKNPAKFFKTVKNPAPVFKQIMEENDGLAKMMLTSRYALMTDRPDLIRYILQKNNKNYIKTSVVKEILGKKIGNNLLTSDGEYWLKQRRAIQPGFHRKRLQGISNIMIDEINHYMDNVLDKKAEKGEEIDLAKEMLHLAFKVVSTSLFGTNISDISLDFIDETVSHTQQLVIDEIRRPFIKPWLYLNGTYRKNKQLLEASDKIILDTIKERKESGEKHDDLIDMLLETKYEDGSGMTDKQLLSEAIILYVAGHETSAVSLSWTWYLLMTHPEIEQQLLQSVKDSIGDEDPSFEGLRDLGYSLQVIEESMRLYPPAWIVDREPLEDDEFEGVHIEKGMDVLCLIYSVHRNKKYWDEPEKFDPERFNPENKKKQIPFSYMPFGGGPRLCIGNNFALMEMQFIIAMMVRRYKFELVEGQDIDINPLITLRPKNGLKARITKRTL
ncbi:MAG: cytochrome P450 [Maribacter sp.]|jgi:cytochrome P450